MNKMQKMTRDDIVGGRQRKVAVVGWYRCGNYGDDLMAVMISEWLAERGWMPCLHASEELAGSVAGVCHAATLHEAMDGAECCVWGGGGLLIPDAACDVYASEVADAAGFFGVPVFLLSVGGGNQELDFNSAPGRAKLINHPQFKGATVRLESNLSLIRPGVPASYHQDVVLAAATRMGVARKRSRELVIGLNLPLYGRSKELARLLSASIGHLPRTKVVYVHTTDRSRHAPMEYEDHRLETLHYRDPAQFLAEISSLDLIISHKLHLGVSALSVGVPFLSWGSSGKVAGFWEGVGCEGVGGGRRRDIVKLVSKFAPGVFRRNARFDHLLPKALSAAKRDAMGHFDALGGFLDRR